MASCEKKTRGQFVPSSTARLNARVVVEGLSSYFLLAIYVTEADIP